MQTVMQWVLFVTKVMSYHVSGNEMVSSEMSNFENNDNFIYPLLLKRIDDLETKIRSMETKLSDSELELDRRMSELSSWEHESGTGITEKNISSSLHFRHCKVAFFASLSRDSTGYLGTNQVIIFDNVVTNRCGAYSKIHGYFFAPVSGTYVFFVTMGEKYGTGYYYITVNGIKRGNLCVGSSNYQASQTLIMYLRKGSHVAVKNGNYRYDKLKGDYHTTFSGFLLR